MNYSAADALGLLAATFLDIPLVVLPGYAVGAATGLFGFRDLPASPRWLLACLIGLALLPLLDSSLVRAFGIAAALGLNGALAAVGIGYAWRARPTLRIGRASGLLVALWFGLVLYGFADFDLGGELRQSLLVLDMVKHAATTRGIAETGAPPIDPFFAREGRAGYYYFFYTLCALTHRLGGGLVDARAAFAGLVFWTGFGLVALIGLLLERSGLVRDAAPASVARCVLLLLPAGGLDVVPVAKSGVTTGVWVPIPEWWNEQVVWWTPSLLWVPHHVSGLLAAWLGFLVLTDLMEGARPTRRAEFVGALVAAAAFASCLGLSVWVALGAVATAGAWTMWLALRRRWRAAALLLGAGVLSLAFAAPHISDLLANRAETTASIALTIRRFGPLEGALEGPLLLVLRLVLLPLNLFTEFGVFASGAILFWRQRAPAEAHGREAARLLTLAAASGLVLGCFLRATVINNDLGWRVVLFPQAVALVWTVAALVRNGQEREGQEREGRAGAPRDRLGMPAFMLALMLVGYGTTAYGLFWLRAFPAAGFPDTAFINARPDVDRALRDAYEWAAANLPLDAVLQHGPAAPRVFDFGLYGRQRVGVADADAMLFGAAKAAVFGRIHDLLPVFASTLAPSEVRVRAGAARVDALVVSAQDPVWDDPASWVWSSKAAYANPRVRIIRVGDL